MSIFRSDGGTKYTASDGRSLSRVDNGNFCYLLINLCILQFILFFYTEISFTDPSSGHTFKFSTQTGQLTQILSGLDASNITVDYLNQTYPALFSHSNGRQMRLYYSPDNKVNYIDVFDETMNIEQSW